MYCYIEGYGNKKFHIDTGCVYNFEFNEKLDSFNMVISNCDTDITFTKFQYFKVASDEPNTFSLTMILDNYTKSIVNLNGTQKFEYTINLMSETKLLEKIKCPNRQILHSLVDGNRTLLEVIRQVCELYIPRVKKIAGADTWTYDYAIDWHNIFDALSNEPVDYFSNIPCPDLSFTKTSLRDVLTTLMLVVGCIPVVRNRTLGCINLRARPTNFNIIDNRILQIQQSNSSDSFTTTLRNPVSSVLDTNNIVRNEIIGFRDSVNVFLKQQENLVLTTDFPIEKVNKLEMYVIQPITVLFGSTYHPFFDDTEINLDNGNIGGTIIADSTIEFYLLDNKPYISGFSDTQYLHTFEPELVATATIPAGATSFDLTSYYGRFTYFVLTLYIRQSGQEKVRVINSLTATGDNDQFRFVYETMFNPVDLTPIVKESEFRKGLDVDYVNVNNLRPIVSGNTIDVSPLADSYYTTLEYTYKKNEIRGFSNHWDWFNWYGQNENTFIDVLNSFLNNNNYSTERNDYRTSIHILLNSYDFMYKYGFAKLVNNVPVVVDGYVFTTTLQDVSMYQFDFNDTELTQFATCVFHIEYTPFNELTLEHSKNEDLPIEFTEFDTQESSIIMLDEFSARELDKVNRLGNDVLQAQQLMTNSFAGVQPLNSLLDGSIVFSVSMEIYENLNQATNTYNRFINVSYVATKNYVLKNYFTALQNKYRAYEYSDDSSATLRQELHKTYVMVSAGKPLLNGSDIIRSSDYTFLISQFLDNYVPLKYAVVGEYSFQQTSDSYKFDCSVVSGKDYIAISHIEPYTNHYGIIIDKYSSSMERLGGYIQKWLPHSETYKLRHRLGYMSENFYQSANISDYDTGLLPKIPLPQYAYEDNFVFYLRNKTNISDDISSYNVNYYSNVGERLSDVVQFCYYCNEEDIYIHKNFFDANRLSVNNGDEFVIIVRDDETFVEDFSELIGTIPTYSINTNTFNCSALLDIIFTNYEGYEDKYCYLSLHRVIDGDDYYKDMIRIKMKDIMSFGVISLHFSLNDTKTLRVYKVNSVGIWELSETCLLNSETRYIN